jgi:hypothetical protein
MSKSPKLKCKSRPILFGIALAALLPSAAMAQYTFDPNNADEQGPGIKYFGSVKDMRGALIPGASILISHSFVLVTDNQGRFRGNVDVGYTADKTPVGCSKPGYSFVRVSKRPGPPGGVKQTVQVDCVLKRNS